MIRQRKPFERKWARHIKRALRQSIERVLLIHDYENISRSDVYIRVNADPIRDVYIALYKDVGLHFAQNEQAKFKRQGFRMETKDEWTNIWVRQMETYAVNQVGRRISSVYAYTQEVIFDKLEVVIKEVQKEGLSISMATERIQKSLSTSMGEVERWRAKRIAQTEIMTASNKGAKIAADSLGIPMLQYWVVSGNNTRDSHYQAQSDNAHGVPMDGTFLVGGFQAEQPGDPSLPASEVINCHCAVIREPI